MAADESRPRVVPRVGTIGGMHDMRTGTCALCEHNVVIEASARDFYGESGQLSEPLAATQQVKASFWTDGRPDAEARSGALKQYICRSCGYTQWFATNPGEIPIGDEYETKLVSGPPKVAPYR